MKAPSQLHSVPCQGGIARRRADDVNRKAAGEGRRPAGLSSPFKKENCLYSTLKERLIVYRLHSR